MLSHLVSPSELERIPAHHHPFQGHLFLELVYFHLQFVLFCQILNVDHWHLLSVIKVGCQHTYLNCRTRYNSPTGSNPAALHLPGKLLLVFFQIACDNQLLTNTLSELCSCCMLGLGFLSFIIFPNMIKLSICLLTPASRFEGRHLCSRCIIYST